MAAEIEIKVNLSDETARSKLAALEKSYNSAMARMGKTGLPIGQFEARLTACIGKLQAFQAEVQKMQWDFAAALSNIGESWEGMISAFLEMTELTLHPTIDATEAKQALQQFMSEWDGRTISFNVDANTGAAIHSVDQAISEISRKHAEIQVAATPTEPDETPTTKPGEGVVAAKIANSAATGFLKDDTVMKAVLPTAPYTSTQAQPEAKPEQADTPKATGIGGTSSGKKSDKAAFETLKTMVDYMLEVVSESAKKQIEALDTQIDLLKQEKEKFEELTRIEAFKKAVDDAMTDLQTARNERTVRYINENGKWEWGADLRSVQKAQEQLDKAQAKLTEDEIERRFDQAIKAAEESKRTLQTDFDSVTDVWEKIKSAVTAPTGDVHELISAVLAGGTAQQTEAAIAVRDQLLPMIESGPFADQAAAPGAPAPGTLSNLIATGGCLTGTITDALRAAESRYNSPAFISNSNVDNSQHFTIGQITLPEGTPETQALSDVMRVLAVYAGK